MKKLLMLALMFIGMNTYANDDVIILQSGEKIEGSITKFAKNSFHMTVNGEKVKIKNREVALVAVGQELTHYEKFRLGKLDGKRFAENKGGNMAIGFFFGLIGSGIVYLTSDQSPSYMAAQGDNKMIMNDPAYLEGYSKGAASKSGGQALIGTGVSIVALWALVFSASSAY